MFITIKSITIFSQFIQQTNNEIWSILFKKLLEWSKNQNSFLQYYYSRILFYLDEDIFHNQQSELIDNTIVRNIKDFIREQCMTDVMLSFYNILLQYQNNNIQICNSVLEAMRGYIEWTDINLIYNDKVLPLLINYLNNNELKCNSLLCIDEIVSKGMNASDKVQILNGLHINIFLLYSIYFLINLFELLQSFNLQDEYFIKAVGEISYDLCSTLLDLYEEKEFVYNNINI